MVGLEYVSLKEEHILSAADLLQHYQIIGTPLAIGKLEQNHWLSRQVRRESHVVSVRYRIYLVISKGETAVLLAAFARHLSVGCCIGQQKEARSLGAHL